MNSKEINWVEWIKKGDELSFSMIYDTHVNELLSYGRSLGFQEENCKDAIQDAFYQLHISRTRLGHVQNITAYLFRIFKNNLLDQKKRNRRDEAIDQHINTFGIHVTVLDDIIDEETSDLLKKKVAELLNKLTVNQKEVVYLKYMVGLQHKDISEIMNINEESARKLLYRAIEKLRKHAYDSNLPEKLLLMQLVIALS